MAVIGTGRIANLPEQVGERFPVAQRQSYGQIQPVRARNHGEAVADAGRTEARCRLAEGEVGAGAAVRRIDLVGVPS